MAKPTKLSSSRAENAADAAPKPQAKRKITRRQPKLRTSTEPEFIRVARADPSSATQAGAVPYRVNAHGKIEVCLVTSSDGRWSLPKGTIEPGDSPHETAVTETLEEVGLVGVVSDPSLGVWRYVKGGNRTLVLFYAMLVTAELHHWLERHRRERCWVPLELAPDVVDRPGLDEIIRVFAERPSLRQAG